MTDMTPRRVTLACLPTPLVPAPRLAEVLGAGELWIKRDDLTGFAVAGNKARALEFLLGDALATGSDLLVAGGSVNSNFCAAAAVAARRAGLDCELLFPESASGRRLDQRGHRARRRSATSLRRRANARGARRGRVGAGRRAPGGGPPSVPTAPWRGDADRRDRIRLRGRGDRAAERRARDPPGRRRGGDWIRDHAGRTGRRPGRVTDFPGGSSARR